MALIRSISSNPELDEYIVNFELKHTQTKLPTKLRQRFHEVERPALQPLPAARFPCFNEGQRIVHRDGHVEVDKAYYSVPPEYLGRQVWVRWDNHMVRVFNRGRVLVARFVNNVEQHGGSMHPGCDRLKWRD